MEEIHKFLNELTGISIKTIDKLIISVAILLILGIVRFILLRIVWRQTKNVKARYQWKRTLSFIVPFVGILIIGVVWMQAFKQFGAFLGLFTAGLAIAMKDPLTNLAGWFFIVIRKPFVVGDRVQIGKHSGDIIDIRMFQFTILEIGNWVDADQSTGRIIHLPNAKVFQQSQANYSTGFNYIWNEIPVLVTFESNWQKARKILEDIIGNAEHLSSTAEKEILKASRNFMIYYTHLTPIIYTRVEDSGVKLTIRYLCDPRRRRGSENDIWEDILLAFSKHDDVEFAYPTTRFYTEGNKTNFDNPT